VICGEKTESAGLRAALETFGIQNISYCKDTDAMLDRMDDGMVDLLLCHSDEVGESFPKVIQDIRRKSRGRNPFVIVIATVTDSTISEVKSLLDGGVDDLIRSPISSERLLAGIEKFTKQRKPFVASHDYVGPTRRSEKRDAADPTGLFEAPNSLHCKVMQNVSDDELQRMVDVGQFELGDRRLEATAIEIDKLAKIVKKRYTPEDGGEALAPLLARLSVLADDLFVKSSGTSFHQVGNLTKILASLVRRIDIKLPQPVTTDVELLNKLAQAIRRSVTVERHAVELMQEIIETVAGYTNPNEAPRAAGKSQRQSSQTN
jgi:DNA-binding response OmpR family regulator